MIGSYSFGKMFINGKHYGKDLLIDNGEVIPNWWREKGHFLQLADLRTVLRDLPAVVIIGAGKYGRMEVSQEVTDYFDKSGIEYHIMKTDKAVQLYNEMKNADRKLVAGFHLTC